MLFFEKWKVILILLVCALGVVYAVPSFTPRETVAGLPSWAPHKQIPLGLDLQGGSHLLVEVDVNTVIRERLNGLVDEVRSALRRINVGYTNLGVAGFGVTFTLRDAVDVPRVREAISRIDPDTTVSVEGSRIQLTLTERAIAERKGAVVQQSIEIVNRRVNEMGVVEATIVRQGSDRILVQVPGFDDPERLKALIGKTAKLNFQLVDLSMPPEDAQAGRAPPGSELLPSDHERDASGRPVMYLVQRRIMVSGENLVDARASFQDNQPVVSFRFDAVGARRFGEVTRANVGKPFAIVLDGKVISAPVIREPILGGSGIISGRFTVQETQDLALLLRAGALPAPLTVLEERTIGAELGADSILAGEIACIAAYLLIAILMLVSYGLFGIVANIGLLLNLVFTITIMALLEATLTLPGIAGMVLGLAMSIDANVLVYERMREEERAGRTVISAIDVSFRRAYITIIDSNVTVFLASMILYLFGSGPVRGFAVTLSIGIVCSMFTAVTLNRMLVVQWLAWRRPKALPI
jgi:preprotein translocase subunit SecD